jgi:rhamnose transport system ATP-binding protein
MNLGIAYVSEDRRQLGLCCRCRSSPTSRCRCCVATSIASASFAPARAPRPPDAFRTARDPRAVGRLAVAKLSGGNQQKVMLSKWLNTNPFDPDSRRADARRRRRLQAEVHAIIGELAAEGIGVIVISSDLPEVLALSDRVLVMREGRQMAILDRADADPESVMNAAMGQSLRDPESLRPAS